VDFSFIFRFIFKMKYLENRSSKLRTVFTFEILALRSLKLDPTFFYTCTFGVALSLHDLRLCLVHERELYLL
jgi:hypothetical protein